MAISFVRKAKSVQQTVIEALQAKDLPKACPVCGQRSWVVAQGVTYLELGVPGTRYTTGYREEAIPCVPVVCNHCGNTLLFNLIVLGIWDQLRG